MSWVYIRSLIEQANVSDLLHQIPESATDAVLQDVVYCGVCRPYSDINLDASSWLQASGIQEDEVLIAIPKGMDLNRVHALAEPILIDPHVASVVRNFFPFHLGVPQRS